MDNLSKEEKNALKKEWEATQDQEYILTEDFVQELFAYLEEQLNDTGCDHTLRHTKQWLKDTISDALFESVLEEITNMGGYCDCEVLLNCYEDYDIC